MNILFANYGGFSTNSILHIASFANTLARAGHCCMVALPEIDTPPDLPEAPLFQYGTYSEIEASNLRFPNKRPADILHLWTPRQNVHGFGKRYRARNASKTIVHLEDNEDALLESFYQTPIQSLRENGLPHSFTQWEPSLSHPTQFKECLKAADAITAIITPLLQFSSPHHLQLELWPGIATPAPSSLSPAKRAAEFKRLGIPQGHKLIVYTGGISSSNQEDIRTLYQAIEQLNQQGWPTKLLKTGPNAGCFVRSLSNEIKANIIDLGRIPAEKIPETIALADVLVQPGQPDSFNNYRLPSKLPDYLLSGKPVILPQSNIAHKMSENNVALRLKEGSAEEITTLCIQLYRDPELSRHLGETGIQFARQHFSLETNTRKLEAFYKSVLQSPASRSSSKVKSKTNFLKRLNPFK